MANVYLDHNATTPVRPEAAAAMADACGHVGNPSSVHQDGRAARRVVEDAREAVAALIGATPANLVFTSGGTEANAMALRGTDRPAIVSAVEHESVLAARPDARGLAVDRQGRVDPADVAAALQGADAPAVVSVMLANNETGVIQPVAEIAEIAHAHGALVHCDAVQAVGKIAVDVESLGVDLLTVSAHKLGGVPGVGALFVRAGLDLDPLLEGGGQERRRRAGTENLPGIAAFGAAAAAVNVETMRQLAQFRDRIEAAVRDAAPDAVIHGAGTGRLANTVCIGLPGVSGQVQVMNLDLAGVSVSAGSACSSGKVTASHVLKAMGLEGEAAGEAIRVSLGWTTTEDEVERFIAAWTRMAHSRTSTRERQVA